MNTRNPNQKNRHLRRGAIGFGLAVIISTICATLFFFGLALCDYFMK